jgi:RNA 2',3'-cyclic 3'-phosphodiesterase
MRLFFALWPDDNVRLALASQRLEIARTTGGRPTMPVTLHLTMVYAGNVSPSRVTEIKMLASQIRVPAFDFRIDVAGCFEGARVAWLASDTPPEGMHKLQKALQTAMLEAGFDVDRRKFRPHITVARDVTTIFEPHPIAPLIWRIDNFCLVEAQQSGNSVRYEMLDRWMLQST